MISAPDMEPQYRQSVRASFTRAPDFARTPAMLGLAAPMVFAALEADFDLVLETASELIGTFDVMLSGAHIRFRVAGPRLADDLIAPFAPATRILSPVGDPDLTIDVWDGAATRVACSALPFDREMGPYGLVVCAPDNQFVSYQRPASVGWLDRKRRRVIAWFESADALYLDERAKPFAKLISVWLKDHGVVLGHAGVVGRNGRGILFAGLGGAGKSTTAVACLLSGLDFVGDDYVGLEEQGPGRFYARAYFSTALLDVDRFADLAEHIIAPHHGHEAKSLAHFADWLPHRLPDGLAIGAVVVPRITGGDEHHLRPTSKIDALLALAPSTLLMMPLPEVAQFEMLARLVQSVPTYRLDLGTDLETIPRAIEPILATA
jgi:hypothetical protein